MLLVFNLKNYVNHLQRRTNETKNKQKEKFMCLDCK